MKRLIMAVGTMALLGLLASPAVAALTANLGPNTSSLNNGIGSGTQGGGSFGVSLSGAVQHLAFGPSEGQTWNAGAYTDVPWGRTFCVENVTFTPGVTYNATVDSSILNGGVGQIVTLTTGTRVAFANYVAGNVDPGLDIAKNQGMQAYFWDQQHVLSDGDDWKAVLTGTALSFYQTLETLTATGDEYKVAVLNLWGGAVYQSDKQSHLTMIVPAPAAAGLVFVGLGLIGWLRRRFA